MVAYTTRATTDIANLGPIGFLYLNLGLIVLIPASGLSIWIVHGIRPRFLSSVAGGIRWRLAAALHRGHPAAVGALHDRLVCLPTPSPLRVPIIG